MARKSKGKQDCIFDSRVMRTARSLTISPSMLCSGGSRGVPAPGGRVCLHFQGGCLDDKGKWWYPSMHWGRPPLWTESHTRVMYIRPCPNFVAGGKNYLPLRTIMFPITTIRSFCFLFFSIGRRSWVSWLCCGQFTFPSREPDNTHRGKLVTS